HIEQARLTSRQAGVDSRTRRHFPEADGETQMKGYRRLAIALVVPVLLTLIARRAQIAAPQTPLQAAGAQAGAARGANPAAAPSQDPAARGARGTRGGGSGNAGPTTELLRFMSVDKPDFGIRVTQTFDASGKPAYETKGGDLLFFTNASVSYNSTAD